MTSILACRSSHGVEMVTKDGTGLSKGKVRHSKRSTSLVRRINLCCASDDTPFRLYRESNPALKHITWTSIAGTLDELKAVAADLASHGNKHSTEMSKKILGAIPRFEDSESVSTIRSKRPLTRLLTACRNGSVASTECNAKRISTIKQLRIRTRAEPEGSALGMPFRTMTREPVMGALQSKMEPVFGAARGHLEPRRLHLMLHDSLPREGK